MWVLETCDANRKILSWYKMPVICMAWRAVSVISGLCTVNTGVKAVVRLCGLSSLNSSAHVSSAWVWKQKLKYRNTRSWQYKIATAPHLDSRRQCYKRVFKSPWNTLCDFIFFGLARSFLVLVNICLKPIKDKNFQWLINKMLWMV